MNIVEEWKPTAGFPGYEVSNLGSVRNGLTLQKLIPQSNKKGYLQVHIGSKKPFVHRLVITVFIGKAPSDLHVVNHKDGNKRNNCVGNLEWVTHSENMRHSYSLGLRISPRKGNGGTKHPMVKLTPEQVQTIKDSRGKVYQRVLAERYGITQAAVSKIQLGQRRSD